MKTQTHRMARALVSGVAAIALAAPTAGAVPAGPDPSTPAEDGTAPVVESIDEGFDWASAAIGAGGAGALMLLISVTGTTYRHRHRQTADDQVGATR
jgi:hypothetical protein